MWAVYRPCLSLSTNFWNQGNVYSCYSESLYAVSSIEQGEAVPGLVKWNLIWMGLHDVTEASQENAKALGCQILLALAEGELLMTLGSRWS